jgi:hypothetical protein
MPTLPTPKRPKRGEGSAGPGRLERILFSFMGPPELGDHKAPEGYVRDPSADLCHRCAQPWDGHERVHTASTTHLRCPASQD